MVDLLLYSYFRGLCAFVWFRHRQKCPLRFVMRHIHVSLTSRLSIRDRTEKPSLKWGRRTKSLRSPGVKHHEMLSITFIFLIFYVIALEFSNILDKNTFYLACTIAYHLLICNESGKVLYQFEIQALIWYTCWIALWIGRLLSRYWSELIFNGFLRHHPSEVAHRGESGPRAYARGGFWG